MKVFSKKHQVLTVKTFFCYRTEYKKLKTFRSNKSLVFSILATIFVVNDKNNTSDMLLIQRDEKVVHTANVANRENSAIPA